MKMEFRCILHYDQIAQVIFQNNFLIEAVKTSNFEIKYLGHFWAKGSKTFCVIFFMMSANFY